MVEQELVMTSSPKKKIGFFSAILIVAGGSIGAGIFLRSKSVLEAGAGNIVWALILWLIAGFAITCMAVALVEVASGRNDNLGQIGWCKSFNALPIYKANKYIMTYLYLPFTYFFMPYYVIVQLQDGISLGLGKSVNLGLNGGWIYFAIALVMTVFFIFTSGLNSRSGNIQNWIYTVSKFLAIIVTVVLGFFFFGRTLSQGKGANLWVSVKAGDLFKASSQSFLGLSPLLLTFSAFGGIIFAFDGFYVTAGIQSEMKEPKKTPLALVIGLMGVTATYMIIAASMTIGAGDGKAPTGDFYSFEAQLGSVNATPLFFVVNMLIAVGILGILNGFTLWATRFVEDLIREGEIPVPASIYRYLKHSKTPIVGALFCLTLSIPFMLILTVIGIYAFPNVTWDFLGDDYGTKIGSLLSFADVMANWMAIFAFAFIAMAIIGMIRNRKLHFIEVKEGKHSVWTGYVGAIFVFVTMAMNILDPFVSLVMNSVKYQTVPEAGKDELFIKLVGNISLVVLFVTFTTFAFVAPYVEKFAAERNIKKCERILSGDVCECEKPYYCPCTLELYKEKLEMNRLILSTFEKQVR